jgi:methyl-accepting chemotaxis protein
MVEDAAHLADEVSAEVETIAAASEQQTAMVAEVGRAVDDLSQVADAEIDVEVPDADVDVSTAAADGSADLLDDGTLRNDGGFDWVDGERER